MYSMYQKQVYLVVENKLNKQGFLSWLTDCRRGENNFEIILNKKMAEIAKNGLTS